MDLITSALAIMLHISFSDLHRSCFILEETPLVVKPGKGTAWIGGSLPPSSPSRSRRRSQ